MTLKAQVLICIVLIIALIAIVNMVRKRSLELKYVLVWICADIILFIFTLFPSTMGHVAAFFGIYSPVKYDLLYGICSFTCNYFYIDSGIIKSNCKSQETCTDDCVTG